MFFALGHNTTVCRNCMAIRGVVMFERSLRAWKYFHCLERDNIANNLPCLCNVSLQYFNLEIQKYIILKYNMSGSLHPYSTKKNLRVYNNKKFRQFFKTLFLHFYMLPLWCGNFCFLHWAHYFWQCMCHNMRVNSARALERWDQNRIETKISLQFSGNPLSNIVCAKKRKLFFYYILCLGCALVFASEAKIEIEAKISFRLEAKKAWFRLFHTEAKQQKSVAKKNVK